MIIETLISSLDGDGRSRLAPMGAVVESDGWERFELRPFEGSETLANLRRCGEGVLHLSDDVEWVSRAIAGDWSESPEWVPARQVAVPRLAAACLAVEFRVVWDSARDGRACLQCQGLDHHAGPAWRGWNRARHAVLEAAVWVSRADFVPLAEIRGRLSELQVLVDKTGGEREHRAFQRLVRHLERSGAGNG